MGGNPEEFMGAPLRYLDLCQSTPWNDSSSTGPKSIRYGPRKRLRNEKKERANKPRDGQRLRSDRLRERDSVAAEVLADTG